MWVEVVDIKLVDVTLHHHTVSHLGGRQGLKVVLILDTSHGTDHLDPLHPAFISFLFGCLLLNGQLFKHFFDTVRAVQDFHDFHLDLHISGVDFPPLLIWGVLGQWLGYDAVGCRWSRVVKSASGPSTFPTGCGMLVDVDLLHDS